MGYSSWADPDDAEREEGKRLNWEEKHLSDEKCSNCGGWLEIGFERYGDDADGNRGINREVLFCRECGDSEE